MEANDVVLHVLRELNASFRELTGEVHKLRTDLTEHRTQARGWEGQLGRRQDSLEARVSAHDKQLEGLSGVGEVVAQIKKWAVYLFAGGIILAVILFVVLLVATKAKGFFG